LQFTAVTFSHRTAPFEVRQGLGVAPDRIIPLCRRLASELRLGECVILSTCDRVEFHVHEAEDGAVQDLANVLLRAQGIKTWRAGDDTILRGSDAAGHLLRLAAGLESRVLGENDILMQLKSAYRLACEAGTVGMLMHRAFHAAFRVGKRVRTETDLCAGRRSVGSVAVREARKEIGSLKGRAVLVIGAGQVAAAVVRALLSRDVPRLTIANRTPSAARDLANRLAASRGVKATGLEELKSMVDASDIVFSATSSQDPILGADEIRSHAPDRPLWIWDLAVPRDVRDGCGDESSIFVRNVDGVLGRVLDDEECRRRAIPSSEAIVAEELAALESWVSTLASSDAVTNLVMESDGLLERFREELAGRLSEDDLAAASRVARRMQQRLLNAAIRQLKGHGQSPENGNED